MPLAQQTRSQLVRAQALEDSGKPLAAARERIYIAPLLEGQTAFDNHQAIWSLLSTLPRTQLNETGDNDLAGWLELVLLTKATSSLEQQQTDIKQWIANNPWHPAAKQLPQALQQLQQLQAQNIKILALLLPSKDANQNVVDALRNGFFAAHYIAQASGQASDASIFRSTPSLPSLLHSQSRQRQRRQPVECWPSPPQVPHQIP